MYVTHLSIFGGLALGLGFLMGSQGVVYYVRVLQTKLDVVDVAHISTKACGCYVVHFFRALRLLLATFTQRKLVFALASLLQSIVQKNQIGFPCLSYGLVEVHVCRIF